MDVDRREIVRFRDAYVNLGRAVGQFLALSEDERVSMRFYRDPGKQPSFFDAQQIEELAKSFPSDEINAGMMSGKLEALAALRKAASSASKTMPLDEWPVLLKDQQFQMGLSDDFSEKLDNWCRTQTDTPTRAEAIRRLVEMAISAPRETLGAPSKAISQDGDYIAADVQKMGDGFGFNVVNRRRGPMLSLSYQTRDDAEEARANVALALARAIGAMAHGGNRNEFG